MLEDALDCEIIEMVYEGNVVAYLEIVERYKNVVYSIILQMTDNVFSAHNLTIKTFVYAFFNINDYDENLKLSVWLSKCAFDTSYNFKKNYIINTSNSNNNKMQTVVERAIEKLHFEDRLPILFYHKYGFSFCEIAFIYKKAKSTIKNNIYASRELLKNELIKLEKGEYNEM